MLLQNSKNWQKNNWSKVAPLALFLTRNIAENICDLNYEVVTKPTLSFCKAIDEK